MWRKSMYDFFLNRVDKKGVFVGFYLKKKRNYKKYGNILRYVSEIINGYICSWKEFFLPIRQGLLNIITAVFLLLLD